MPRRQLAYIRDTGPEARGQFLHFCLEWACPGKDFTNPEELAHTAVLHGCYKHPSEYALSLEHNIHMREELEGVLAWFFRQPDSLHWLTAGMRETTFVNESRTKRVDLLVNYPKTCLVVDYKTGQHKPNYAVPMRSYIALASYFRKSLIPVIGVLVYLDLKKFCLLDDRMMTQLHDSFASAVQELQDLRLEHRGITESILAGMDDGTGNKQGITENSEEV